MLIYDTFLLVKTIIICEFYCFWVQILASYAYLRITNLCFLLEFILLSDVGKVNVTIFWYYDKRNQLVSSVKFIKHNISLTSTYYLFMAWFELCQLLVQMVSLPNKDHTEDTSSFSTLLVLLYKHQLLYCIVKL